MGNSTSELTQTLYALRLMKLCLEPYAVGFGLQAHTFGLILQVLDHDSVGYGLLAHTFGLPADTQNLFIGLDASGGISNYGAHETALIDGNCRHGDLSLEFASVASSTHDIHACGAWSAVHARDGNDRIDVTSDEFLAAIAEEVPGLSVHQHDEARLVIHEHCVRSLVENGA